MGTELAGHDISQLEQKQQGLDLLWPQAVPRCPPQRPGGVPISWLEWSCGQHSAGRAPGRPVQAPAPWRLTVSLSRPVLPPFPHVHRGQQTVLGAA